MEKPNSTVIGNAVSAYFLFFVCLAFLWSKKANINDPFVKNHVKTAFTLQIIFVIMLFLMSYPLGDGIIILGYSINTIIQIALSLIIFMGIFYGAHTASKGKTLTFGELFHTGTGKSGEILLSTKTENIGEETKSLLALSHIPFIGYMIYPSHKNLPRIRDIIQINFIVTLICVLLYIGGVANLANLFFLIYIIWAVFSSINMFSRDEILAFNLDIIPTVTEKYILQKSLFVYLKNMLRKKVFTPFSDIKTSQEIVYTEREKTYKKNTTEKKSSPMPSIIYYIPIINIIGLFMLHTRDTYHIRNGLIITIISILLGYFYGVNHPIMLLILFPISFGIGYLYKKEYSMPYIDDLSRFSISLIYNLTHIFSRARTLRKTNITETTKIGETKKES